EGYRLLIGIRQKQVRELIQRLKVCGLGDYAGSMEARIQAFAGATG
ncbi:MAG: hypothetical protein IIC89_06965, partial [Chloroflexi bacterium]|nr:hypothetical protein [Chloroflexota bacterium]